MQETNTFCSRFTQFLFSLMIDQYGPKYVEVSGFYNIIVNLTQLYAFVGLNDSNLSGML